LPSGRRLSIAGSLIRERLVRRWRAPDVVFAGAAAASVPVLLWFGRGLTFFSDEWAFIAERSLTDPSTWWAPHNEHWSTIPILVYRALVETVGLRTYVPYLALVILLNVVVAVLVRRQVERRAGPWPALAAGMLVLFLGSGFENLYWGFQVGFVGATALGMGALEVLDGAPTRGRAAALVVLLVAGLMTAGVGLFFLAVVAVELLFRPDRRRWLGLLLIPIGIYATWFILIGREGIGAHRDPFSLATMAHIPEFLVAGFGAAAGAVTGVGPGPGVVVAAVILAAALWHLARKRELPVRLVAASVGIAVQYALIAVTRAGVTTGQVHYSRYTYVAVVLALVALGALLGPALRDLARTTGRRRFAGLAGAAVVLELAFIWNLRLLAEGRQIFVERAEMTRALVTVALASDRPAAVDLGRSLVLVPSPTRLEGIVAAHGSPLNDVLEPWAVPAIRPEILAEAERRLIYGAPVPTDEDITN